MAHCEFFSIAKMITMSIGAQNAVPYRVEVKVHEPVNGLNCSAHADEEMRTMAVISREDEATPFGDEANPLQGQDQHFQVGAVPFATSGRLVSL